MDPRRRSTCKLSFRLANLPAIQLLHRDRTRFEDIASEVEKS